MGLQKKKVPTTGSSMYRVKILPAHRWANFSMRSLPTMRTMEFMATKRQISVGIMPVTQPIKVSPPLLNMPMNPCARKIIVSIIFLSSFHNS